MPEPKARYTPADYLELERHSEARHEYLDGALFVQLSDQPLVNGEYTQLNHQVSMGSMSAVYEVRFTLNSSTCSLYWNLNP